MFSLVFSRRYAMAHRLLSGNSVKCAVPHGHNETVTVRLQAVAPERLDGHANMVESFEKAKKTWHRWIDDAVDHTFQLSETDPLLAVFTQTEPHLLPRLLVTPGDPTTEILAACFMSKINAFLAAEGGRLRCVELRIEETPTNTVIFEGDPADVLPLSAGGDRWWLRADMSINDLAAPPGLRLATP
ncbi:6-carboxytetrahydropterin synthase [Telmatospirillum sp. J64-1]|uniref:6-pyruvoyl trahydropterin synthase family protein n=1 Tax=Telmatospirillum sp. J64-1 TaxID=2502183 RepID=UPI00115EC83E|nr:6-carboxytetrahydropterin synthase [Telmatospirillum sp. J64-1]